MKVEFTRSVADQTEITKVTWEFDMEEYFDLFRSTYYECPPSEPLLIMTRDLSAICVDSISPSKSITKSFVLEPDPTKKAI